MNRSFKCPSCNHIADFLVVDGYQFGDRLLEDVKFAVCQDQTTGDWSASLADPRDSAYFENLNTTKWLKAAADFAKETDLMECPQCHADMDPEEDAV